VAAVITHGTVITHSPVMAYSGIAAMATNSTAMVLSPLH
jgi:hypothetical protein